MIKKSKGYTLIEILVALAIFSIFSLITATILNQAFDIKARISDKANKLEQIQLALLTIEKDSKNLIDRPMRSNDLQLFPSFVGQPDYIEFTRINPLTRVAYRCKKNQLIRRTWINIDPPKRSMHTDKVLLNNLNKCSFGYLSHYREILSIWQSQMNPSQNNNKDNVPRALQFNLGWEKLGNMSLLYQIQYATYEN